jgi:hypothetical protein
MTAETPFGDWPRQMHLQCQLNRAKSAETGQDPAPNRHIHPGVVVGQRTPSVGLSHCLIFVAARLVVSILALVPGPAAAQGPPPEERYADWARPVFPADEHVARRGRLISALVRNGGGVMLVPSATGATDGDTFRQADGFLYFTGLEVPQSLLWVDAEAGSVVLYAPVRDPRWENPGRSNDFPGRQLAGDPALIG